MKKLTALLLAALMLFCACSTALGPDAGAEAVYEAYLDGNAVIEALLDYTAVKDEVADCIYENAAVDIREAQFISTVTRDTENATYPITVTSTDGQWHYISSFAIVKTESGYALQNGGTYSYYGVLEEGDTLLVCTEGEPAVYENRLIAAANSFFEGGCTVMEGGIIADGNMAQVAVTADGVKYRLTFVVSREAGVESYSLFDLDNMSEATETETE